MKKYSTSEAIAMLEKNPKLVFEGEVRVCGDIKTGKKVRMWVNSCHEIQIDGFSVGARYGLNTNDEWELIQQPVSFMEAAKAYSEGKTIRCEIDGRTYIYEPNSDTEAADNMGYCFQEKGDSESWVTTCEILNGKWYIGGSNE